MNRFRSLLLDIAQNLTSDDVRDIKFACTDVIPAGRAEHITRPHELFLELERMNQLSESNRDFLGTILVRIGRSDMRNKLLEISDTAGNVQQIPQGVRNPMFVRTSVTDDLISSIAEDVSIHWKVLGRKLQLGETIIQNIDNDNRRTLEKATQVLHSWKRRSDNATVQALIDALTKSGRRDLAEKVEEIMSREQVSQTENEPTEGYDTQPTVVHGRVKAFDMRPLQTNLPPVQPNRRPPQPAEHDGPVHIREAASLQQADISEARELREPHEEMAERPDSGVQTNTRLPIPDSEGKMKLDRIGSYLDPKKYIISDLLGTGGFAKVYLCIKRETNETLAVKLVDLGDNDALTHKQTEALEQEINVLKSLNNPYIVKYFETVTEQHTLAMFIEYMPGGSICQLVRSRGPILEETIQEYTWQILVGLLYLHDNNITHRDIKGANILLDEQKKYIKLADFGISIAMEGLATSTGAYMTKGMAASVYWTSPELLSAEHYGKNTDIWSVGCTVVEMMTGKPPLLDNMTIAQAMFRISTHQVTPPHTCSPNARNFLTLCFSSKTSRPSAEALLKESSFPIVCPCPGHVIEQ